MIYADIKLIKFYCVIWKNKEKNKLSYILFLVVQTLNSLKLSFKVWYKEIKEIYDLEEFQTELSSTHCL